MTSKKLRAKASQTRRKLDEAKKNNPSISAQHWSDIDIDVSRTCPVCGLRQVSIYTNTCMVCGSKKGP